MELFPSPIHSNMDKHTPTIKLTMSIGCKKKMIPKIAWETYIKTPIGISPFPNAILETARRNQVPFMGQVVSKSTYALGVFCNPWVL
jgi:hypothetical protein